MRLYTQEKPTEGKKMTPGKRLFTLEQAGIYLGRSEWTIGDMCRKGILPYIQDRDRKFIDVKDLDEWIKANKRKEDLRKKYFSPQFSS